MKDAHEHKIIPTDTLVGVVLAGGFSSRLGEDKLQLTIGDDDSPNLLEQTVSLLSRYCKRVLVACRSQQNFAAYSCINDKYDGMGPVAGIHTAMVTAKRPILVLSCDLPFMNDVILGKLIDSHATRPATAIMTTFRQAETGFIEALTSIYEPDCLTLFANAIAQKKRQINLLVPPERRHDIVYTRSEALPFFNVNFPEDLLRARALKKAQISNQPFFRCSSE